MRKAYDFIILLCLCLSNKIIAQNNIIPNGDFESSNSSACIKGAGNGTSFDDNIANWKIAEHSNDAGEGWPDWLIFSDCQYAQHCYSYNNSSDNAFVAIKADIHKCEKRTIFDGLKIKRTHEAIAVGLENGVAFTAYQTYTIRYKIIPIKAQNFDKDKDRPECINLQKDCHLRIFLTEKGYQNWNDNSNNAKQELYSANYITNSGDNPPCHWLQIERTFTVNYAGMKNLVLYAESGGFIIDDVEIFQKCDNDVLIQNKSYNFPLYTPYFQNGNHFSEQSGDYIEAGYNVGATNTGVGNVIVQNGSSIVYTAANKISLKPGFRAEQGSYFHALIADCPNEKKMDYIDTNMENDSDYIQEPIDNAIEKKQLLIIPNPNEGIFKVRVSHEGRLSTTKASVVIDCLGKIVWKKENILSTEFEVTISSQPKGIYYVKVMDESGALYVAKIINQ